MTDDIKAGIFFPIAIDPDSIRTVVKRIRTIVSKLSESVIYLKLDVDVGDVEARAAEAENALHGMGSAGDSAGEEIKDGADEASGGISDLISNAQFLATTLISLGGIKIFGAAIDSASELEDRINKVRAVLAAQGVSVERTTMQIADMANAYQNFSKYSNTAILEAQQLLLAIGLTTEQLPDATKAAMDMATALGTDLASAATMVGKAIRHESGVLSRYGIIVDEAAYKSDKFKAVIDTIQTSFGGAAQRDLQTYSGSVEYLKNSWSDFLATIGRAVIGDGVLTSLIIDLRNVIVAIDDWAKENPIVTKTIVYLAGAITGVASALTALKVVTSVTKGIGALSESMKALAASSTAASAAAANTSKELAKTGKAGVGAATAIGTAFITIAVAALVAVYSETKRLEAETERLNKQIEEDNKIWVQQRTEQMQTWAKQLGAIMATTNSINRESILYQRAVKAAVASGKTEADLVQLIYEERRRITEEMQKQRDIDSKSIRDYQTFIANLNSEVRTAINEVAAGNDELMSSFIRGENALGKFQQGLSGLSIEIDNAAKSLNGAFAFGVKQDEIQAKFENMLAALQEAGIKTEYEKTLVERLAKAFSTASQTNDDMTKTVETRVAMQSELIQKALEAGAITHEEALEGIQINRSLRERLANLKKVESESEKRWQLNGQIKDVDAQIADLNDKIEAKKKAQLAATQRLEEIEKKREAAIANIPALEESILTLRTKQEDQLIRESNLIHQKYTGLIDLARREGESRERIQELELQYVEERLKYENKIAEARKSANDALREQIRSNSQEIADYFKEVDDYIRRLKGEGALVDIEGEIKRAQALVQKIETDKDAEKLRTAAQTKLEAMLEPFQQQIESDRKAIGDKTKEIEKLNEEYQNERADIIEQGKKDGLTRNQIREKLDASKKVYEERIAAIQTEIKDLEADIQKEQELRRRAQETIAREIQVMEESIAQRKADIQARDAALERQRLIDEISKFGAVTEEGQKFMREATLDALREYLAGLQNKSALAGSGDAEALNAAYQESADRIKKPVQDTEKSIQDQKDALDKASASVNELWKAYQDERKRILADGQAQGKTQEEVAAELKAAQKDYQDRRAAIQEEIASIRERIATEKQLLEQRKAVMAQELAALQADFEAKKALLDAGKQDLTGVAPTDEAARLGEGAVQAAAEAAPATPAISQEAIAKVASVADKFEAIADMDQAFSGVVTSLDNVAAASEQLNATMVTFAQTATGKLDQMATSIQNVEGQIAGLTQQVAAIGQPQEEDESIEETMGQ